jgi:5-formyltetrahydrofolate cyclo-ligase
MTSKVEVRKKMRARIREEEPSRLERSMALCTRLAAFQPYVEAGVVAIFDPMPSEPAIDLLWELAPRKFLYPRIDGGEIRLLPVSDPSELLASAAGLLFREPPLVDSGAVPIPQMVLVPGLAFARDGHRLGRGGGYYDRLLAGLPAETLRVAVCFSFQLVDELPTEPHDERVHAVITEDEIFVANR